ncbi:MAG: hypothetical protein ASARMPREDX12_007403 [Alectoria sarmentosa]|nr:MAG: hypothetical protein ASARMPREDX12_007403 [Alectoria sarmentosa]
MIQDQDNEELQIAIQRLSIRSIAPPTRLFRISRHRTSPVKGNGWFAAQKIMRGMSLLAEKALFEAVGSNTEDEITAKRDGLLPPDLADFNALTCANLPISVKNIFDTTALRCTKRSKAR